MFTSFVIYPAYSFCTKAALIPFILLHKIYVSIPLFVIRTAFSIEQTIAIKNK